MHFEVSIPQDKTKGGEQSEDPPAIGSARFARRVSQDAL